MKKGLGLEGIFEVPFQAGLKKNKAPIPNDVIERSFTKNWKPKQEKMEDDSRNAKKPASEH